MSNRTTGRILVVGILLVVFVPLILLSIKQPVVIGLPTLVFALTGVWVLVGQARGNRRDQR